MTNINLSQSSAERRKMESQGIFDKTLVISIGLIALSFGTLFGLKMYNASLNSKAAELDSEIAAKSKGLEGDAVNRVVDFQMRSEEIAKKLADTTLSSQDMFVLVEKLMVQGVSLDSYEYDTQKKALSIKAVSGDFKSVAQQIMSFKSNSTFKGVSVKSTSRDDKGAIIFDLTASL